MKSTLTRQITCYHSLKRYLRFLMEAKTITIIILTRVIILKINPKILTIRQTKHPISITYHLHCNNITICKIFFLGYILIINLNNCSINSLFLLFLLPMVSRISLWLLMAIMPHLLKKMLIFLAKILYYKCSHKPNCLDQVKMLNTSKVYIKYL